MSSPQDNHARKAVARNLSVVLILAVILSISFLSVLPLGINKSSAESTGQWGATTSYPSGLFSLYGSCVIWSGYVYCIGGESPYVLYAPISSSGISNWAFTTSYPSYIVSPSCAVSSGYVYCVAGENNNGLNNSVYYASISSSGVGAWKSTTSYPFVTMAESCVIYSGYIYCVGGFTNTAIATKSVYYAPVSSSGVGAWTNTTSYAGGITQQSCVTSNGFIYCVGGVNDNGDIVDSVSYAPISSSGVGTWASTSSYPMDISQQSCATSSSYIYCIGGSYDNGIQYVTNAVYDSLINSAGVGSWSGASSYPIDINDQSCAASSDFVYCIGGFTNNGTPIGTSYYNELVPSIGSVGTWDNTRNYPLNVTTNSCVPSSGYV